MTQTHASDAPERAPDNGNRAVLVVEDEAELRSLLQRHLSRRGHRVVEAGDAESAVRRLLAEPALDLVLTDIHLPGLSGLDLLTLIQSHSPMKPVLVMTGDDQDSLSRDALAAGAAGYLLKPFQLAELDGQVSQALHRLELLERLGELGRQGPTTGPFGVPVAWLELADRRSGAGGGHGRRVERLVAALARPLDLGLPAGTLALAARVHELGRLTAATDRDDAIPALTSALLERVSAAPEVRSIVEGMGAWWGGALAPGATGRGAAVLMVADRIDHGAAERTAAGVFPPTAILESVEEVADQARSRLGAEAEMAVRSTGEVLSAIWILGRGGYDGTPAAEGSS